MGAPYLSPVRTTAWLPVPCPGTGVLDALCSRLFGCAPYLTIPAQLALDSEHRQRTRMEVGDGVCVGAASATPPERVWRSCGTRNSTQPAPGPYALQVLLPGQRQGHTLPLKQPNPFAPGRAIEARAAS